MSPGKSRLHVRDEQGSRGALRERRQLVLAEFAVNMLTESPAPQASVFTLQRRGGVEAQRAPAHRL